MAIDPNKSYKTRDGRAVRIYATDGAPPTPIQGAVLCHLYSDTAKRRGWWYMHAWKANGRNAEIDGWVCGASDPGPHSWLDLMETEK